MPIPMMRPPAPIDQLRPGESLYKLDIEYASAPKIKEFSKFDMMAI
jgi:hypothetical protein